MQTREQQNKERAAYVLTQFHEYQRDYAYPLGRMFAIMGDDEEARKDVLHEIEQSDETPAIKYAAAKLFRLYDTLCDANGMQEHHDALLLALLDPNLGLEQTSLIFGMYCNKNLMRHTSQNNLFTRTTYPNMSSDEWRNIVSVLQRYCFAKLKAELNALPSDKEKITLLRLAQDEMHIFFRKESSLTVSDATNVGQYRSWIAGELEKLEVTKAPVRP